nr:probable E3 ubiquitin-protein ligase DTX3 isoform X1 [Paramormyrops kingsleyae]
MTGITVSVSSATMSVLVGQDSDVVLVSQVVWDYLDTARQSWLLDFQNRHGLYVEVVRHGESGDCCAVRLRAVENSAAGGDIHPAARRAFIDLCRCARKEMSRQNGAAKRRCSLLPCVRSSQTDGEGSLLAPPPPQARHIQKPHLKDKKPIDLDTTISVPMYHNPSAGREAEFGTSLGADSGTTCTICMGEIVERTTLDKCGHSFCRTCLDQAFQVKRACPVCRMVYGQLIGNQPANGSMMVERDPDLELPGHEGYGCVCIIYSFPPGLQAQEHPNPGVRYPGTDRVAYLPDSPEGNRVLGLLRRAFEQRLIFTIGTSMTTGMQNVITWNDIHHKTSIWGGPRCFGYPDPTYLVRVTEELREKGITAD